MSGMANLSRNLRFEEGIGNDEDVINSFREGMRNGYESGDRPNQNARAWYKHREETMSERAHAGSAAWVDAPDKLAAFANGTGTEAERRIVSIQNANAVGHLHRAKNVVQD